MGLTWKDHKQKVADLALFQTKIFEKGCRSWAPLCFFSADRIAAPENWRVQTSIQHVGGLLLLNPVDRLDSRSFGRCRTWALADSIFHQATEETEHKCERSRSPRDAKRSGECPGILVEAWNQRNWSQQRMAASFWGSPKMRGSILTKWCVLWPPPIGVRMIVGPSRSAASEKSLCTWAKYHGLIQNVFKKAWDSGKPIFRFRRSLGNRRYWM